MAWNQVSVTHDGKDVIAWQREEIVNLPNILGDKPKTVVIDNSKHNVISSWVDDRDDIIFLTVDLPKGKAKDKGEPNGESTESGN